MLYTKEYEKGWGAWAEHFGFKQYNLAHYTHYEVPPGWENGWISERNPAPGLYVSSAWFTPEITLEYTMHIEKPCLWIFCVDCGDLIFTRKGKPEVKLSPATHLVINPQKPFRLTLPAGVHACFTCILVFDEYIEAYLKANQHDYPIRVKDAPLWKPQHVDSPDIMLIMEQIRWGVRGNRMPLIAYNCKTIELLFMIAHNAEYERRAKNRRHYVTWNDEKKLYKVRERIDLNPLNPPGAEEMCRLAEMGESKLRIAFKSLYGTTVYAYMRTAVMKRAMQMLADDELSIKNIAALCGYENPAKFTAAFKDVHGITPSLFRKSFSL